MVPFIVLLTVPIIITPFLKNVKISKTSFYNFSLFLFFVILTILVMFRHKYIGNDTGNYMTYFMKYSYYGWGQFRKAGIEPGFFIYNKIIALFTRDPHVFIAVSGILVSALIYPTYRRLCEDPVLTIVLFCTMSTFSMMFSGIRQMLAVGIGLIAYEFVRRRKLIFFIIVVVIAVTIHTSAFMLAFMYPLFYAKITRKWLFVVVPALAVLFVFNKQVFAALGSILESFTEYEVSQTQTGAFTMLVLLVGFAVVAYLIPNESDLDDETLALRNFLLLTIVIQMFAPLNFWAMRMNFYYLIFVPLLIPRILMRTSVRFGQISVIIRYAMIVFFLVYFFRTVGASGGLHIAPYHFFWENYYL